MFDSLAVQGDLHLPSGDGRRPAVIIASGRAYHRDLPLIRQLAEKAAAEGLVAARFDWRYHTAGTEPAADGKDILADAREVLGALKRHPRVDPSRIAIAGKSMGSTVAWTVFRSQKTAAVALLTPLAPSHEVRARTYSGFADEGRPVLLVGGKGDPFAASLGALAMASPPNITTLVVGGGHGLSESGTDSRYVPLVVDCTVAWLKRVLI